VPKLGSMKADAMRAFTISPSPKQLERILEAVDSGGYASNSDVLRDALRLWNSARNCVVSISRG
jgi:antitoxin ParD1/3/4